jgi:hypothetical protein
VQYIEDESEEEATGWMSLSGIVLGLKNGVTFFGGPHNKQLR